MSPILVRPVREQLEHDRVIRLLQAKYKRKFEVAINPGNEHTAPVGPGPSPWYPDLVLFSSERSRKLVGVVEVETSESINHLEAMSQWRTFAGLKVAFHLYVPVSGVDSARRLCTELQIPTTEIWAYNSIGDQIRFTPVQRAPQAGDGRGGRAVAETMTTRPREAAVAARPRETAVAAKPPAPAKPAAPPRAAAARPRTTRGAAKPAGRAAAPAKPRAAVARAKSAPPRRAAAKAPARKPASSASKAQKRK
ncbi:MAG TPA: hypothetical protein VI485_00530 [Vicinamibacterales bacterium]|nr:hypothetical protein [Vicinamibacterales bacterium]